MLDFGLPHCVGQHIHINRVNIGASMGVSYDLHHLPQLPAPAVGEQGPTMGFCNIIGASIVSFKGGDELFEFS